MPFLKNLMEKPLRKFLNLTPKSVHGLYAKTKAAASNCIKRSQTKGLNASIVHPSGIIGPGITVVLI